MFVQSENIQFFNSAINTLVQATGVRILTEQTAHQTQTLIHHFTSRRVFRQIPSNPSNSVGCHLAARAGPYEQFHV